MRLKRVSIFLIAVALIAGMVGCREPAPPHASIVSAGTYHTVWLKPDGTVVAVGNNDYGQCDVAFFDLDGPFY